MKRITDKDFVWIPSHQTDVRKTIEKARKEIEAQKQREKDEAAARLKAVIDIKRRTK